MTNRIDIKKLSDHAHQSLVQVKAKKIDAAAQALTKITEMSLLDILEKGININDAPFALAGKLAQRNWKHIYFDKKENDWRAFTLNYSMSITISPDQIIEMLEEQE